MWFKSYFSAKSQSFVALFHGNLHQVSHSSQPQIVFDENKLQLRISLFLNSSSLYLEPFEFALINHQSE